MKHSDYHGKLLRLAMVFVALFLCGTMAYAQTDRMISGIVVDENGDPLPAAHIRQVSQTKGEELAAVIFLDVFVSQLLDLIFKILNFIL